MTDRVVRSGGDPAGTPPVRRPRASRAWYLLLVLPFAGLLYPPLYAREHPSIGGFPFFYWYQLAWVPVTALLTYFVYRVTRPARHYQPSAGGEGR